MEEEFFEPYEGRLFKVRVLAGRVSIPESYPYCMTCKCQFVNQNFQRMKHEALVLNCPKPCNQELRITEQALKAQRHAVKSLVEARLHNEMSMPRKRLGAMTKLIDWVLHNFWGRFNIREQVAAQVAAQIVRGIYLIGVTILGIYFAPKGIKRFIHQSFVMKHSADTETNQQYISINHSPGASVVQGSSTQK